MGFELKNRVNFSNIKSYSASKIESNYVHNPEMYDPSKISYEDYESQYKQIENANIKQMANSTNSAHQNNLGTIFENNEATSDVAMAVGGFANGVGNFGENIVDTGAIGVTALASPFTWIYDKVTGSNKTEEMWNKTNAFVSEEHVNNAFEDFYTNNELGKAMNENASEVMQYGNAGYNAAVGVGYLTATVVAAAGVSSVANLGMTAIGTAGRVSSIADMATSGTLISGGAGFGRGTSDALNRGADTKEALTAGAMTGLWEGTQWATGAKIAGKGIKTIAFDASSGGIDPLVRSGIQTVYNDKTFEENFKQNGGFTGMATNALIGGGFSALGEIPTFTPNSISFFDENKGFNNNYGVDQGVFKKMPSKNITYQNTAQYLTDLGFSDKDARKVMSIVDKEGACSYSEFANEIINSYKNKPELFEKNFGYPMYTSTGQLNDTQLLMDLYVFANKTDNGGSLFQYQGNQLKIVNDDASNQLYYWSNWPNTSLINRFLKSKDPNLTYNVEYLGSRSDLADNFDKDTGKKILYDTNSLKNKIDEALTSGKNVGMTIWYPKHTGHIKLHNMSNKSQVSTKDWGENEGHAIFVTGTDYKGVIVSSWGGKYRINWKDLKFSQFYVSASTIQ